MTDPDALERELASRRSPWPYLAGFAVALVGAVVAFLMWPQEPSPYRVLVTSTGLEGGAHDRLVSSVRGPLGVGGFRVLELQDGAPPQDAEGARVLAFEAHAQHSVFVTVEVVEERPRGAIEPAYVLARGSATVGDVSGEGAVEIPPLEIAAFGETAEEAIEDAAERLGEGLADAIHLALIERASVEAFIESTSVATDELSFQAAMRAAHDRLDRVHEERTWMAESCEEADAALVDDHGSTEVRCVSGGCAEEYAFDVLPDGSAALVHTETPSVRLPLVGELAVAERVESVERIDVVPLDGSERRTIATADNYYTYPSMSADGRRVAAVEEWPRGFGLVVIDMADGTRTALARFDHYVQAPRMSPDGSAILASLRARRRAPAQLVVVPAQVGAELRLLGESHLARWVVVTPPGADAPGDYVAELTPIEAPAGEDSEEPLEPEEAAPEVAEEEASEEEVPEGEVPEEEGVLPALELEHRLSILDPSDGSVRATLDDDRHRVRRVIGQLEGAVVFTWYNGRVCGLGRWDPAESEAEYTQTERCLRHAHLAEDGRAVGAARVSAEGDPSAGDDELVVTGLDGSPLTILTANGLRERYPRAARRGSRVIFDRLGDSRYREFPRVALCWLER